MLAKTVDDLWINRRERLQGQIHCNSLSQERGQVGRLCSGTGCCCVGSMLPSLASHWERGYQLVDLGNGDGVMLQHPGKGVAGKQMSQQQGLGVHLVTPPLLSA